MRGVFAKEAAASRLMEDIRFGIIHGAETLKFEEGSREFNEEGVHLLYGLKVQGKHFVKVTALLCFVKVIVFSIRFCR